MKGEGSPQQIAATFSCIALKIPNLTRETANIRQAGTWFVTENVYESSFMIEASSNPDLSLPGSLIDFSTDQGPTWD